jgi:hypothetical protein
MTKRKYYVICTQVHGRWCVAWGSYSKAECVQEIEDSYAEEATCIITTTATQAGINAEVAGLNKGTHHG